MVKASPQVYRDTANGGMMDGENVTHLRNQFIGEEKGLRYLTNLLAQREKDLREELEKQSKTQT